MGVRIDSAVTNFKSVEKKYLKLNLVGEYIFDFEADEADIYHFIFTENDIIKDLSLYFEEAEPFSDYFKSMYDEFYKTESAKFINEFLINILNLESVKETGFYKFILEILSKYDKDNLFIHECFGVIKIYNGYSIINRTVWEKESFATCNEDGLLLLRALNNLDDLYGFKIEDILVYYEDLIYYGVGECERLEASINLDTTKYVKDFEEFLSAVIKREDDEFFEERYERWLIILEHLKQGVRYVYSV